MVKQQQRPQLEGASPQDPKVAGSEHPQRPSPPAAVFLIPVVWGWAGTSSDLSRGPRGPSPDRTEGWDQVSALLGALWDLEALGRLEGHRGEEGFCTFPSNTPRSPRPRPSLCLVSASRASFWGGEQARGAELSLMAASPRTAGGMADLSPRLAPCKSFSLRGHCIHEIWGPPW